MSELDRAPESTGREVFRVRWDVHLGGAGRRRSVLFQVILRPRSRRQRAAGSANAIGLPDVLDASLKIILRVVHRGTDLFQSHHLAVPFEVGPDFVYPPGTTQRRESLTMLRSDV